MLSQVIKNPLIDRVWHSVRFIPSDRDKQNPTKPEIRHCTVIEEESLGFGLACYVARQDILFFWIELL